MCNPTSENVCKVSPEGRKTGEISSFDESEGIVCWLRTCKCLYRRIKSLQFSKSLNFFFRLRGPTYTSFLDLSLRTSQRERRILCSVEDHLLVLSFDPLVLLISIPSSVVRNTSVVDVLLPLVLSDKNKPKLLINLDCHMRRKRVRREWFSPFKGTIFFYQ